MSLREKSNEELGRLLSEYGIKHGPIVESTRKVYESKLEKVMTQAPVKASTDKTFYREEEEVTYVTYHNAAKHEHSANMVKRRVMTDQEEVDQPGLDTESVFKVPYNSINHTSIQSKESIGRKSTGRLWKLTLVLLLLAVLAAVGYYAYVYVM